MAELLDAADPASLERAAAVLRGGGVVVFPTETVYGVGADALNPAAVARVFEAKGRPSFDPLIVHVSSADQAASLWESVPDAARRLMEAFWPGPLTLVLPKNSIVPDIVTAGLPTLAVRMPRHEAAQGMIRRLGRPVAAPSANLFGFTSATTAEDAAEDLGDRVDLVLDAGRTAVGVESTVLKLSGGEAEILRPGGVTMEEIEKFIPVDRTASGKPTGRSPSAIESPGQLASHYATRTPLYLVSNWPVRLNGRVGAIVFGEGRRPAALAHVENLSPSGDLRQAAARLFAAMRKLDRMGLDRIAAERVPEEGIGVAIMDRLKKASKGTL